MPVDGFNYATSNTTSANVARSVVRAATGSASDQLVGTVVSKPNDFSYESDTGKKAYDASADGLQTTVISASGHVLGPADDRRKLAEVTLTKQIEADDVHAILSITERDLTNFQRTIDGKFIQASGGNGTYVNPTGHDTIDLERINNSGDYAVKTRYEDAGGRAYYIIGDTAVVKGLEARSQ